MISILPELVDDTVGELRRCGAGRRECILFWIASLENPVVVVDVIHPDHTSSPVGYEVDGRWLTEFFFDLADAHRTAVAQVHTHPGRSVNPSAIDDRFVLVPSPGFVSIIVPDFAMPFDRNATAAFVLLGNGTWQRDEGAILW